MAKKQSVARSQNGHDEIARYEKELAGMLQERIKPGLNRGAIPLLARSIAKDIASREHPGAAPEDEPRDEADEVEEDFDEEAEGEDDVDAEAEDDFDEEAEDDDVDAEADDDVDAEADDDVDAEADDDVDAEAEEDFDEEADDDDVDAEAEEDFDEEADDDEAEAEGEDEQGDPRLEIPAEFEADMLDFQSELGEDWIVRFSVQGDTAWLTAEKADGTQRLEAPTATVLAEAVQLLSGNGDEPG